ncbi:MAG TPA: hypothetical protein VJ849_09110, partial [Actinomycetes bacterium]|nr:hypothetical protein [Actinomycetes bacterium]
MRRAPRHGTHGGWTAGDTGAGPPPGRLPTVVVVGRPGVGGHTEAAANGTTRLARVTMAWTAER